MQGTQLRYAIKFVADMDKAVKFHRDVLGLKLKFESPGWSEFATGETTLALHPASDKNPAGKVELGFTVPDVEAFYRDMTAKGVLFSMPPKKQDFGGVLAQFVDSEGAHCSVGAEGRSDSKLRSLWHRIEPARNGMSWTDAKVGSHLFASICH